MEETKCQQPLQDLQLLRLTKGLNDLKDELTKSKDNQRLLENAQMKLEIILQNYGVRFSKIEFGIDKICAEIRSVGDKLLIMQTKEDTIKSEKSTEKEKSGGLAEALQNNHKLMCTLIIILGVVVLFSLGMKATEIVSTFIE